MNRFLTLIVLTMAVVACQSRPAGTPQEEPQEAAQAEPVAVPQGQNLQRTIEADGFSSKGTIQAIREVPVFSRISNRNRP